MSAQTWTITDSNPVQLIPHGGYDSITTIANIDTKNSIILSEDTTLSGVTLTAGSSIGWDPGKALFARLDPSLPVGTVVSVNVIQNGGQWYNGQSVANALLSSGLATQISNAIVTSGLTAAAIAANISVSGAPPIDVNAIIVSVSGVTVPQFTNGTSYGPYNVSTYQSLFVEALEVTTVFGTTPPGIRRIQLLWSLLDGTLVDIDSFWLTDNNSLVNNTGTASMRVSVKAPRVTINVSQNAGATTTYNLVAIGSYKAVSVTKYSFQSNYGPTVGTALGSFGDNLTEWQITSLTGVASGTFYPNVKSGPASISASGQGGPTTAGSWRAYIIPVGRNVPLFDTGIRSVAVNAIDVYPITQIILPNQPIQMVLISNTSTVVTQNLRLSMTQSA